MPNTPVPPELDEFLAQPNPSVISTVGPDGSPHTAATWYLRENGRILVNMADTRKRLENMRRDPRVSLTVIGKDNFYNQVTLRGEVVEFADDEDLAGIDRLAVQYMGQPYGRHGQKRVNAWIEVESWYGWSGGDYWSGEKS
jgi:PPOX class probable F420-dependent enzyme